MMMFPSGTHQDAELQFGSLAGSVAGVAVEVAVLSRRGWRPPVVFLHGFGSSKEDFADVALHEEFAGRGILAIDAPGCGGTTCSDLSRVSMTFLRDTAAQIIASSGFDRFHLVGHSMGGLAGLLLACEAAGKVLSFTSIEGNLTPGDCFLSRQVVTHPAASAVSFLDAFVGRVRCLPAFASAHYASNIPGKVRAEAVAPIFRSMVAHSEHDELLGRFLTLPCPRLFVHGDQNGGLSYLGALRSAGITVAEIPACGHFPMYSNPPAMWQALADFLATVENHRP